MVTKLNPEVIAEGSITADKINIESLKTDSGVVTQDVLKTVNGQSILGSGDIAISSDANVQAVDTGDVLDDVNVEYATTAYVDNKVANISLTDYATTAYVDGLIGDINSVLESIISGGGGVSLITFTIDGTEYQAEQGMTWEQWINSDYNPGTFAKHANGQHITYTSISYSYIQLNDVNILYTAPILSEGYTIFDPDM